MLRAADEIYYVPEGTPLSTQLVKFQRNKKKVGLVVNEYGDIQGLVTVEDILEEIVGDFTTSMSPSLAEEVTPQNDGSVLIDGSANIRELNKAFNWHLPEDEARTINGMILEALEEIPAAGTRVRIEQYDIDILDVQDNMIKQVKVLPVKPCAKVSLSKVVGRVSGEAATRHYGAANYAFAFATVTIAARMVRPFRV
jgi:Mg2+/Co2+ transporter CorB